MAEGLPEGLVASNTEVVSEGIERHDRVDEEDLARLWRAYSTNRSLLVNDIGRRLENFFWRIWGSSRCRENLRGSQVAFLFALISEGEIIRTTPIPSPRSSRMVTRTSTEQQLQPTQTSSSPESPALETEDDTRVPRSQLEDDQVLPLSVEEEKGRRRSSSRPPPILKRPGIESGSKKTATILTPTWKTGASDPAHDEADDMPRRTSGGRSSLSKSESASASDKSGQLNEPFSPTSPQGSKPSNTAKGKKKPSFIVGASSTKRRPALTRRKSSQSSSGGNSKVPSPKFSPGYQFNASSRRGAPALSPPVEGSTNPGHTRATSRSVSPISSSPFKRPPRDHLPLSGDATVESAPASQDWLVDRNFRGSFADRMRGSIPSGSKSTAATGLSTTFQATGSSFGSQEGKKRAKTTVEEDMENLKLERLPSQVLDEESEEEELAGLPRVKSQLTMMLQEQEKDDKKGESSSKTKGRKTKR